VVVLVDEDGDRSRKTRLVEHTADLPGTRVIAVAVREFEAWLLADESALREVLDGEVETTTAPEEMPRAEAKRRFGELCDAGRGDANRKTHQHDMRHAVCRSADLEAIARRCQSFSAFLDDLRAARGQREPASRE
jgi:hypothetical protein